MAADETCRTYTVDGEPVVVRGPRPLDEQDQTALAELVHAAKARAERTDPHAGLRQELLAVLRLARHCIPDGPVHAGVLGARDGAEVRRRLTTAAAAVRDWLAPVDESLTDERDVLLVRLADAVQLPRGTSEGVLLAEVRARFKGVVRAVVGHRYVNGGNRCECGLPTPTGGDWFRHVDELRAAGVKTAHLEPDPPSAPPTGPAGSEVTDG
ncbi:MAG TPA: hypothetical protein VJ914_40320 [Pseudonocardiaceae bacterium]|nr:hypothetical protein [Pseudonocardiaceae bacterium]